MTRIGATGWMALGMAAAMTLAAPAAGAPGSGKARARSAPEPAAHAETRRWILATIAPEGSPSASTVEQIRALVARATGGALQIKPRYGGILGDEKDAALKCQQGRIQVWGGSLGALVSLVPEMRFMELPYLFPDLPSFQRVMREFHYGRKGDFQTFFNRRGFVVLGFAPVGWRNISSVSLPVRSPANLRGLRVRSQPSELQLETWRSWGAIPKPAALTELNSALEVEMIEAFDVPATFVYATSLDSRIKHYTLTRHMLQVGIAIINRDAWEALPAAWREKILAGTDEIISRTQDEHVKYDEELIGLLPRRGVSIHTLTDAERGAFRAAATAAEASWRRTASKEEVSLLERVREIVARRGE